MDAATKMVMAEQAVTSPGHFLSASRSAVYADPALLGWDSNLYLEGAEKAAGIQPADRPASPAAVEQRWLASSYSYAFDPLTAK